MNQDAIITLIGASFLLVGFLTLLFFIRRALQAARSRHWPTTVGTLEKQGTRIVDYNGHEPDGSPDFARAMVVDFRYTYQVDGRRYTGSRVTFSDHVSKSAGTLQRLLRQFDSRHQVTVHYNPDNPAESVLLPGLRPANFGPMLTSLAMIGAGLWLLSAFSG